MLEPNADFERSFDAIFNPKPSAWMVVDKATGEKVELSKDKPTGTWLSECYQVIPLYDLGNK